MKVHWLGVPDTNSPALTNHWEAREVTFSKQSANCCLLDLWLYLIHGSLPLQMSYANAMARFWNHLTSIILTTSCLAGLNTRLAIKFDRQHWSTCCRTHRPLLHHIQCWKQYTKTASNKDDLHKFSSESLERQTPVNCWILQAGYDSCKISNLVALMTVSESNQLFLVWALRTGRSYHLLCHLQSTNYCHQLG